MRSRTGERGTSTRPELTCIRGGLGWVAQGLASSTGINVWKEREDEEKEKGTGERRRERECNQGDRP